MLTSRPGKATSADGLRDKFKARIPTLQAAAARLEKDLREILDGVPRIDAIRTREKGLDRFLEKVQRKEYDHPLDEMQDQVGARVVVQFLEDVERVRKILLKHYSAVEDAMHAPENPSVFDYEAWHMICALPATIKKDCPVPFFELQIATLFQHAWAELHHDLGYKTEKDVPFERQRLMAHAAAQAWGADHTMQKLLETK
jgi:putative GTP pyrophosphokinase